MMDLVAIAVAFGSMGVGVGITAGITYRWVLMRSEERISRASTVQIIFEGDVNGWDDFIQ